MPVALLTDVHRIDEIGLEGESVFKKAFITLLGVAIAATVVCGCSAASDGTTDAGASTSSSDPAQATIAYRYATKDEGKERLSANKEYWAGFSQNDLDFRMQKTGATMEEYQAFAVEQIQDFTDDEKAFLDECMSDMENTLVDGGYTLPELDEVVFVKSTTAEECYAAAYTHGTTVFLSADLLDYCLFPEEWTEEDEAADAAEEGATAEEGDAVEEGEDYFTMQEILWHELFHCLTRCNPDFRADMYQLINFTAHGEDYVLPPSVFEYHISNPDVEHHDSSAIFSIDGKDVECFCDFVTTKHFEEEGDSFFDFSTTALVPVDGTDTYYTPEQAANFDEVFGENTDYEVDPEECMADNFAFALAYGTAGWDGNGYKTPEIIEGILSYLSK